jgi:hypothetical protein
MLIRKEKGLKIKHTPRKYARQDKEEDTKQYPDKLGTGVREKK